MAGGHAYHEGEKILKENMKEYDFQWQRNWHQGIRGIEMEMVQEGMHQWIHLLQMPWLFKMGYVVMIRAFSAKDKAGLGYDSQMNKSEVVYSMFNRRESDVDDSLVNDRFKTGEVFHAVPLPYTGNYMPSRPDLSFTRLDDSIYKTKASETITTAFKTSKDSLEKPQTVRPSAPIIED
ncbi:hypothetical protein Tco_1153094 [Tanacetum coccineum]